MPIAAHVSRRSAIAFIKWTIPISLVLSMFQLMLGGNPTILAISMATGLICLWPVLLYGFERTMGIIFALVWMSFSFSSLLFKTILFQPIDSNLFNPTLTFLIQLAGAAAFALAATIAFLFRPIHKNAIAVVTNPDTLSVMGLICFVLGVAGFLMNHNTSDQVATATGGGLSLMGTIGSLLNPLVGYGGACETIAVIIRSDRKKTFSVRSVLMLGGIMALGLVGNSKSGILLPGTIYLFSIWAFGARLRAGTAIVAVIGLLFVSEFLFPAVHLVRAVRTRLNPIELGAQTIETVVGLMTGDPEILAEKEALASGEARTASDSYRNIYFGSQQVWLDRFTNTGFVDALARRMDFNGPFLGIGPVVGDTFTTVLPRQLDPNKYVGTRISAGDAVLQAYGLQPEYHVSFATVPLPAELFAAGGFFAILLVGTGLVLMPILGVNLLVFDFRGNPWAVCFLVFYGMAFFTQTHDGCAFMALRQMPFDYLFLTGMIILSTAIKNGIHAAGANRAVAAAPTL